MVMQLYNICLWAIFQMLVGMFSAQVHACDRVLHFQMVSDFGFSQRDQIRF